MFIAEVSPPLSVSDDDDDSEEYAWFHYDDSTESLTPGALPEIGQADATRWRPPRRAFGRKVCGGEPLLASPTYTNSSKTRN